eukprot:Gb_21997 [translate_table: standard]
MPSKFHRLVQLTACLRGDARTFKVEKARREVDSSIACYMKDNPGCREEDALKHIEDFYDHSFKELNWEFLKPNEANNDSLCEPKKHAFNLTRGLQFFYTHGDGSGISSTNERTTPEEWGLLEQSTFIPLELKLPRHMDRSWTQVVFDSMELNWMFQEHYEDHFSKVSSDDDARKEHHYALNQQIDENSHPQSHS